MNPYGLVILQMANTDEGFIFVLFVCGGGVPPRVYLRVAQIRRSPLVGTSPRSRDCKGERENKQ